jgi:hypothetical protein
MAQTNVMDVEVKALTKFGFQNEKGEYVGWSKNFKEGDKTQVVPGRKFSVEMYIADSGKQYVNKVIRLLGVEDKPLVAPVFAKTPTAKPLAKAPASETMSKAEWSAKDRSQLIGGLSHDAAAITAAMFGYMSGVDVPEALKTYKELLEGMLKIRDEVR